MTTRTVERPDAGYGIAITLVAGVLLALGYYAVTGFRAGEITGLTFPEPVYGLTVAFLFVIELIKSRQDGFVGLLRAVGFAGVFGALVCLGTEGAVYLVNNPGAALDGYVGITVLSAALVVAALGYFCYLSVVLFDRRQRVTN